MRQWYPAFVEGVKWLQWESVESKFLKGIENMANLGYTAISRWAGASVLIATVGHAIEAGLESCRLAKKFCCLGKNIDFTVRIMMLDHISLLLPKLKMKETVEMLALEVLNVYKEAKVEVATKAIEVLLRHQQFFDSEMLKAHFIPELISTIVKPGSEDVSNMILSNYNGVLEMLLNRNLVTPEHAAIFHKYFKEAWKSKGEAFKLAIRSLPSMAYLDFAFGVEEFTYETDIMDRLLTAELLGTFSSSLPGVNLPINPVAPKNLPQILQGLQNEGRVYSCV